MQAYIDDFETLLISPNITSTLLLLLLLEEFQENLDVSNILYTTARKVNFISVRVHLEVKQLYAQIFVRLIKNRFNYKDRLTHLVSRYHKFRQHIRLLI